MDTLLATRSRKDVKGKSFSDCQYEQQGQALGAFGP